MKTRAFVLALTLFALAGCYREQIATLDAVPGPVRSAFQSQATGGEIQNIQFRKYDTKEYYIAECRDSRGKWWDVSVLADGTIIGKD